MDHCHVVDLTLRHFRKLRTAVIPALGDAPIDPWVQAATVSPQKCCLPGSQSSSPVTFLPPYPLSHLWSPSSRGTCHLWNGAISKTLTPVNIPRLMDPFIKHISQVSCLVCSSVNHVSVFKLIKKQIGWEMGRVSLASNIFQVLFLKLQILFNFQDSLWAGMTAPVHRLEVSGLCLLSLEPIPSSKRHPGRAGSGRYTQCRNSVKRNQFSKPKGINGDF